jgi:hypothetical protein
LIITKKLGWNWKKKSISQKKDSNKNNENKILKNKISGKASFFLLNGEIDKKILILQNNLK